MIDPKLEHLRSLLESFLETDRDITADALVAASGQFKHRSDITRPVQRAPLFHEYQQRQARLRELAVKTDKNAKGKLLSRLANAESQLADTRRRKKMLVVAVRGLIHAAGRANGLKGWQLMFSDYSRIVEDLLAMDALPADNVVHLLPKSDCGHGDRPSTEA